MALSMRQVDEDGTNGHSGSLEAVLLAASTHQEIGRPMFRFVGFLMLFLMHRDPPAVFWPILGLFLRESRYNLRVVLATIFQLFHFPHIDIGFQVPGQARQIADRILPSIEQLVGGPVWDVKDGSGEEVVPFVVQNHATLAALHINRFLAMKMFAGVPAKRDFRPHEAAPPGWESQLRGDHQSRLMILTRPYPLEIFGPHYPRRVIDY